MKDVIIYIIIIIIASNILLIGSIFFSKLFRKWKNRKLHQGLINFLGLSDWFYNMSGEEQTLFKEYYSEVAKTNEWVNSLTEGKIYSTSERPAQLLWMVAATAILNENFEFANRLLSKAQHMCHSPWEKQQVTIAFAFLYYKQKDLLSGARENCISYCETAIRNIEKYGSPENVPTLPFDHLIALYEEDGDTAKAGEIVKKALKLIGERNPAAKQLYQKKLADLGR